MRGPHPQPLSRGGERGARPETATSPSPISGEGGARPRSGREGEGPYPTRKELLARAKWMRANPTEAERRLWSILRDRRLTGFKFRRQQVIEPYIADFVCLAERLIIEADGSQHADNEDDACRDAFLRAQGFRMLRFWNNQVLGESEGVTVAIFAALSTPHPPTASRRAQLRGEQHPVLFRSCRGHDRSPQLSPEMEEGLAGALHA